MFYNANGLLMHNMVAGNFDYVQAGMPKRKKRTLSPDYPRDPAQVYQWLEAIGWQITGKTGVRVFHDYLRENTSSVTVMRPWSNWKRVIAARSRILALGATFMSPRLKARR